MTILDTIFTNIDRFTTLDQLQAFTMNELNKRHINAIAEYSRDLKEHPPNIALDDVDEDYIDAEEWVDSRAFYRTLLGDPRCPRWLEKAIVWRVLGEEEY